MPPSPSWHRSSTLMGLLVIVLALLLIITLHHNLRQFKAHQYQVADASAERLSTQLQQVTAFLEAMRGQAEERLRSNPESGLTKQLFDQMECVDEEQLRIPHLPNGLPPLLAGTLTGHGPLPKPGSERASQFHLALSLSPLLATASDYLANNVGWVYYTSSDNFMYLYPRRASEHVRFDPAIYQQDYWQAVTTHPNANEAILLSRPYDDFGGLGRMVTLSAPVMKEGKLLGMLSIDLLLPRLTELLQQPNLTGELALLNQDNVPLAIVNPSPSPYLPSVAMTYVWQRGALQLTHPLPHNSLTLIYRIGPWALTKALLQQSQTMLLTLLFFAWAAISSLRARSLNHRLEYISHHDQLTGALNRYSLQRELSRQLPPTAVIMFDCDHFKQVNDRCGHLIGDEVLKKLVELCMQTLRPHDRLIRWGGEEFLVLLAGTRHAAGRAADPAELHIICERLRLMIANYPWRELHADLVVTVSLGYCPMAHPNELDHAISQADSALYQAKAQGRNRSVAAISG